VLARWNHARCVFANEGKQPAFDAIGGCTHTAQHSRFTGTALRLGSRASYIYGRELRHAHDGCRYSKSVVPPGTPDGLFRVVYRFDNEQLLEVINRTAHAGALSTLVETANAYRFYFAVYVRSVGLFTPFYMALIGPFRRMIVYPSLLRSVRDSWNQAFGPA
jgi:hypothetical protein